MDIADLEAFIAAVETGSFSRAAERIYLTQPAISKRIANLEHDLGTRLFDRIGRQIALTPAGQSLLASGHRILSEIEDARRGISNIAGLVSGKLCMATSHHIGLHRLPPALKSFHGRYPAVELDLRFMDSEAACQTIEQGRLELAVVTLPRTRSKRLKAARIWDDPLEIVVSQHHSLANRDKVSLTDLRQQPAILPGPSTFTRELILQALGKIRHDIHISMATNYLEVLKMLVSIGFGWSALPRPMIDESLKVVHIEGINIHRQLGIITHAERTLSNASKAMIAAIRATA